MLPVLLLGFSATALRPPTAPPRRGVAAAAKKKARAAGGFGAKPKPPKRPALGKAAAKLLDEHGGDVDAARTVQYKLEALCGKSATFGTGREPLDEKKNKHIDR